MFFNREVVIDKNTLEFSGIWKEYVIQYYTIQKNNNKTEILDMRLSSNVSEKAVLIWAIADKLTSVYKPHIYGEAIVPMK